MADNEMDRDGTRIVALTADLLFAARVRGSAPGARTVRGLEELLGAVGPGTRLVIVDVQAAEAVDAVRRARERAPGAQVVAFGPHVAEGALAAAREAGADRVLPKGAFVRELGSIVAGASE